MCTMIVCSKKVLDVYNTVLEMRKQRMKIVRRTGNVTMNRMPSEPAAPDQVLRFPIPTPQQTSAQTPRKKRSH